MDSPRFVIHLSADGHSGCFHLLAVVNSAATNTGVQVSLESLLSVLQDLYLGVELLGHMMILSLAF